MRIISQSCDSAVLRLWPTFSFRHQHVLHFTASRLSKTSDETNSTNPAARTRRGGSCLQLWTGRWKSDRKWNLYDCRQTWKIFRTKNDVSVAVTFSLRGSAVWSWKADLKCWCTNNESKGPSQLSEQSWRLSATDCETQMWKSPWMHHQEWEVYM